MNASAPLKIITKFGGWGNVHPDVVYVPQGFAGYSYWMVFTPYPLISGTHTLNDRVENPIIRVSNDGTHWEEVPAIKDPLVSAPVNPEWHHADPEIVYSFGRLHVIYATIDVRTDKVIFNAMSCNNDLIWTEPKVIYEDTGAVSPSYQIDGKMWHEWFIRMNSRNHSELLHREGYNLDTLENERSCQLEIMGHVPWHIDVLKVEEGYEALVTAYPSGTLQTRSRLFHAFSKDGLNFKVTGNRPIIQPSKLGWDNRVIYRSTFLKRPDGTYRIWYSAGSWARHFGIGLLEGPLDKLTEPAAADLAPVPRFIDGPAADLAPIPRFIKRLPGDVDGWLRYQISHNVLRHYHSRESEKPMPKAKDEKITVGPP